MASTYSTNLAIQLMGTGDQAGTWGTATNTNLGTLIEQAISGYVTQVVTDGADTTIDIPNGAYGVARNMCIELTGTLTAPRNLVVPLNKKLYFIYNNTSGGFAVTVKTSVGGISVANQSKVILVCNGSVIQSALTTTTVPGGLTTQIQYNNGGAFAGSGLTYNNANGQYAFTAPTSGTAVTVNGFSSNTVRDLNIVRTSSTNTIQNAPNLTFSDGTATNEWTLQAGAGVLGFWNYDGAVWVERFSVNKTGNASLLAASTGYTLNVNGSANTNFTDGTGNYTVQMSSGNTAVGTTTNHTHSLRTNNLDRAIIPAAGGFQIVAPTSGHGLVVGASAYTTPISIGTITTTLIIDCRLSNVFYTTLTAATNVATVTFNNPIDGQTINIFVTQPSGSPYFGATMVGTWAKWPGGVAGTLTSSSGAVDLIVATYRGGSWYATISKGFA